MKILFLIDAFGYARIGGARRVFYETAKALSEGAHHISVICRDDGLESEEASGSKIRFYSYPDKKLISPLKIFYYRKCISNLLKKCIESEKPDAILIHSSSAALGCKSILQSADIPKIYIFHSPWSAEYDIQHGNARGLSNYAVRFLSQLRNSHEETYLSLSDGVVTLSEYMHSLMANYHPKLAGKPFSILPGAADQKRFFPGAEPKSYYRKKIGLRVSNDELVVMTVRRLVERTGVDVLIKSFCRSFPVFNKKAVLLIVGDGPLKGKYEKIALDTGLSDRIIFAGNVDDSILPDYYRAGDLFVMPTKQLEGFGLSTVEALASGLLAIGTAVGGTPEILSQISDELIIGSCDESSISEKLLEFVNNYDALVQKHLDRCIFVGNELYSWQKHADGLLELVERMKRKK